MQNPSITDIRTRYDEFCAEVARDMTKDADTPQGFNRTRSKSTCQTKFYELDTQGNPALGRDYLAQRQKQRTPAERCYERRVLTQMRKRRGAWYMAHACRFDLGLLVSASHRRLARAIAKGAIEALGKRRPTSPSAPGMRSASAREDSKTAPHDRLA